MRVVAFILSYLGTTLIYFSLLAGIFGHTPVHIKLRKIIVIKEFLLI